MRQRLDDTADNADTADPLQKMPPEIKRFLYDFHPPTFVLIFLYVLSPSFDSFFICINKTSLSLFCVAQRDPYQGICEGKGTGIA